MKILSRLNLLKINSISTLGSSMISCMLILVGILPVPVKSIAQDTLLLTLAGAEKIFLDKNLKLLASGFQIDAVEAQVIQARLWENPTLSFDVNAVDPQNNKVLHAGRSGQKAITFEQLIYLGGKKKNEIALAQTNVQVARYELEDLLRNLKYNLRISFYNSYFDRITVEKYDRQLAQLQSIIAAYEDQLAKGNISLKEVVRLKATQLQLYNDRSDLMKNLHEQNQALQVLLGSTSVIYPLFSSTDNRKGNSLLLDSLCSIALQRRSDVKLAEARQQFNHLNIQYQKSLAIPDLRLGTAYDQRGGAFNNQVNITAGISLPFWNRNQGNIKNAEKQSQASKALLEYTRLSVCTEVQQAYYNLLQAEQDSKRSSTQFLQELEQLNEGVFLNFQKKNISLLEFTDFIESYNQMITEYNRVQKNRLTAHETINYVVSKDLL